MASVPALCHIHSYDSTMEQHGTTLSAGSHCEDSQRTKTPIYVGVSFYSQAFAEFVLFIYTPVLFDCTSCDWFSLMLVQPKKLAEC